MPKTTGSNPFVCPWTKGLHLLRFLAYVKRTLSGEFCLILVALNPVRECVSCKKVLSLRRKVSSKKLIIDSEFSANYCQTAPCRCDSSASGCSRGCLISIFGKNYIVVQCFKKAPIADHCWGRKWVGRKVGNGAWIWHFEVIWFLKAVFSFIESSKNVLNFCFDVLFLIA